MGHLNMLAFAVPLFITLMVLEQLVRRKQKLARANLQNSITNVSIGIAERLSDVFVAGLFYFVYDHLQKHYGLFAIRPGLLLWVMLFLGTDFIWYWYHRLAHEINVLWAVHIVHHQSEDFNYTVSARITVLQAFVRTGFWSVLAIAGFPAPMITSLLLLHGFYPFFVHTEVIGKLGILEYFLVTPSHHRVHHACNEQYLDKNYGDVLIIWDKLFGTFRKEDEQPVYGLTHPLKTYSFLWQHVHYFAELWVAMKAESGLGAKMRVLFGPPAKMNTEARQEAERFFGVKQNPVPMRQPLNRYVIWQMILVSVFLFLFVLFENDLDAPVKYVSAGLILLTLINCGAIMEQKQWVFATEFLRLTLLGTLPFFYKIPFIPYENGPQLGLFITVSLITLFYRPLEAVYLHRVYPRRTKR
ncbi:MAG: sterol desaturase family protein [Mucilaginibacter polytrichastri]|nr:sterol desaturase family protein [Mucilaginibacter polytrichastri]